MRRTAISAAVSKMQRTVGSQNFGQTPEIPFRIQLVNVLFRLCRIVLLL